MKMSAAAKSIHAVLQGNDAEFSGVSIDSRKIENKNLFLAIKGPNHDSHNYLDQAEQNGAVGFVVEKPVNVKKPQMIVADTCMALGELAAIWRQDLRHTRFIGITGSNGKTTVKEMVASILTTSGNTVATKGNLNNHIGMPLTLLSVKPEHQYAIIEMGANHAKEIDYMANIAKPHVALVNNAGPAHLEGFGSIEGVAKAKGEIYGHVSHDGVAVINLDDKYADYWLDINSNNRVLTFSLGNQAADVVGEFVNEKLIIRYLDQQIEIDLPLQGQHNHCNALAATTVAMALDVPMLNVKQGLESLKPVGGRLNSITLSAGNIIIDDTYNANSQSFKVAIDVLTSYPKSTVLIMGDMAELGQYADKQHAEIGLYAKQSKVDQFYCCGPLSKAAADSYGEQSLHFSDKQALIENIKVKQYKNTVFLVKGSRSMAMEEVLVSLKQYLENAEN